MIRIYMCGRTEPDHRKAGSIMMKKIVCMMIALMICGCCFGASAEMAQHTEEYPVAGLHFAVPQEFFDAKGLVSAGGTVEVAAGVYVTYWYYTVPDREQQEQSAALYYVFSVGDNREFADVAEEVSHNTGISFVPENAAETGSTEGWKFYLYVASNDEFEAALNEEYAGEYNALRGMKDRIAAALSYYTPFNEYGQMDGQVIQFQATDLDGNPISSEEIFAQNRVTMINLWATWCGPCVGELAELQEIHTRFQDKDCGIVGLLIDTDVDEARRLISEYGITYPVYLAQDQLYNVIPFSAVPTSLFVDRSGAFLGTKFTGAWPDMYETALEPLLETAEKTQQ